MTYRKIKEIFPIDITDALRELYKTRETEILDETDLVIFRLMGANFKYADVEFHNTNQFS